MLLLAKWFESMGGDGYKDFNKWLLEGEKLKMKCFNMFQTSHPLVLHDGILITKS